MSFTDSGYKITNITNGKNVSVNQTTSNGTTGFTIKANTNVKYFNSNEPTPVSSDRFSTWISGNSYNEVKDVYVRNIFKGKEIKIEKRWNDDNNADGLRPEILDVTLHEDFEVGTEQTKPSPVSLTKQLKNSEKWGRTVLLPKYYYNGLTPTQSVLVSVSEDLNTAKLHYYSTTDNTTLAKVNYQQEQTGYIFYNSQAASETEKYTDKPSDFTGTSEDNPLYATSQGESSTTESLYGMYIINKKDHINSQLKFHKNWDDSNNQLNARPDSIFIKTIRKTKGSLDINDNNQFSIDPSVVDTTQIALIKGLPASDGNNHAYRYYFDPELPYTTSTNSDGTIDLNVNINGASGKYTLKRSVELYESETFAPDANGLFTVSSTKTVNETLVHRDINGLLSVRIKDLPVSDGEVNYIYRVVGNNGIPLTDVEVNQYPSGDGEKDLVISKNVGVSGNLSFKLQRFPEYTTVNNVDPTPGSHEGETYTVPASEAVNNRITVTLNGFEASDEFDIENLTAEWGNITVTDGTVTGNSKSIVITADYISEEPMTDFKFKIHRASYKTLTDINAKLFFESDIPYEYTPSNDVYTIEASDKINDVYSFKIEGLESGEYRLIKPEADPETGNTIVIPASISYSQKSDSTRDAFVTVSNYADDLRFKIQKSTGNGEFKDYTNTVKVGKYTEQTVTKDNNGSSIRVGYFPANASPDTVKEDSYGNLIGYGDKPLTSTTGGVFNIPADYSFKNKFSILIKDLPADYTVTADSAMTEQRTSGETTVDILVTKDGTEGFTITVAPPEGETLPDPVKAVRFFKADANGIVELPSDADINYAVSEHLDYGISYGATQTENGSWEQYYYTVTECSEQGVDNQSSMTYSQSDVQASADTVIAKKLTFTLDISNYHSTGNDPRKYLNIKVVNGSGGSTIKKDIDGNALKLKMTTTVIEDGETKTVTKEYYASNTDTDTPKEGVFVIPAPEECDYVVCEVDNLPIELEDNQNPQYTVERCKVTGDTHKNQLTFKTGEGPAVTDSTAVKSLVSFTYNKTWTEEAANYKLIPDKVYLKLCRYYIAGNGAEVDESVGSITKDVPTGYRSVGETITEFPAYTPLPAGRFVIVSGIGRVWRPYSYYLKEYDSADNQNSANVSAPTISYNNLYKSSFTYAPDQPFVLDKSKYLYAGLDQGVKNELRKTKHEVKKIWNDEGDDVPNSRDKYTISLQSKTGQGNWTDVDLRYVSLLNVTDTEVVVNGSKVNKKTYSKVTLPSSTDPITSYEVPYVSYQPTKRLHYCFDNLPLFDANGLDYSYRVVEKKIGTNDVKENEAYLFLVPGTEPTDDETSYVRTIRRGTKNYYVDYSESSKSEYTADDGSVYDGTAPKGETVSYTETDITNAIIDNIVTYSNYKATKVWDDNNNLYGKRPDSITYVLRRTKTTPEGVTTLDDSFASSLEGNESNNWEVKWTRCAAFDNKGNTFTYYITENTVDYYTVADKKEGLSDTLVYEFTNTYEPPLRDVTAYKYWEDRSDMFKERPASINYQLYCKYDTYTSEPVYDESDTPNLIGYKYTKNPEGYNGPAGAEGSLVKSFLPSAENNDIVTLKSTNADNGDSNTWKVTFKNLPSYVNTCNTYNNKKINGRASEVTYYIVETVDDKTTAVYECADAADSKKSDEKTLYLYAQKGKASANANSNGLITLSKKEYSDSSESSGYLYNGTVYALLEGLPETSIYNEVGVGKENQREKYEYSVKEFKSDGTTEVSGSNIKLTKSSFHDNSKGTTTYVVSKELPKIHFKIMRKAKLSSSSDTYSEDLVVTRGSGEVNSLTVTVNGITYTADSNGVFEVPQYFTDTNCLTAKSLNLPSADVSGKPYTYSVIECNADGTALSSNTMLLLSAPRSDSVDLTITKPLGTQDANIYFKLYRKPITDSTANPLTYGTEEEPLKDIVYESPVCAEKNTELYPVNKNGVITIHKSAANPDKMQSKTYISTSGATFSVPKADAFNDRINVIVSGLPVLANGQTYNISHNGQVLSSIVKDNNTTTSILVSVPVESGDGANVSFTISASDSTPLSGSYTASHVNCDYLVVNVPDLPQKDSSNNFYTYSVEECRDKNGTAISDPSAAIGYEVKNVGEDKVLMIVSKPLPREYYQVLANGNPVINIGSTSPVRAVAKGIAYSANSEGIFGVPQFCAVGETLTFQIPDLPKKDSNNVDISYTVRKCDALGNVDTSAAILTPSSEDTEHETVALTVTDTINSDIFFKVKRSVNNGEAEVVKNIVSSTKNLTSSSFKISQDEITGENVLRGAGDIDLSITNKLATRDILVTKEWNDNYYGQDKVADGNVKTSDLSKKLHYQTAIELSSVYFTSMTGGKYEETKYLSNTDSDLQYGVVFRDLPIYKYVNNAVSVIDYKVTEYKDNRDTPTPSAGSDLAKPGEGAWNQNSPTPYYSGEPSEVTTESGLFEQKTGETAANSGKYHQNYGYEGSAKKYNKTISIGNNQSYTYVSRYHITDELPLTAVKVNKHWLDQNNEFSLRPTVIKDVNKSETVASGTYSLDLTLKRRAYGSNGDWLQINPVTVQASGDTDIDWFTDWYDSTNQKKTPVDSGTNKNEWTYTYNKLLKFDDTNTLYSFQINEAGVNAYETPQYCVANEYDKAADNDPATTYTNKQTIETDTNLTTLSDNTKSWNGLTPLEATMDITNKLDTRDIKVYKHWDDDNNKYNTRYQVDVTLSSDEVNTGANNTAVGHIRNYSNKYKETLTIELQSNNNESLKYVTFENLPKYDKDGNVIVYNVSEKANSGGNNNNVFTVPDEFITTTGSGENTTYTAHFILKGLDGNNGASTPLTYYYRIVNAVDGSEFVNDHQTTTTDPCYMTSSVVDGKKDITVHLTSTKKPILLKLQRTTTDPTESEGVYTYTNCTDVQNVEIQLAKRSGDNVLATLPLFTEGTRKYNYAGSATYVANEEVNKTINSNASGVFDITISASDVLDGKFTLIIKGLDAKNGEDAYNYIVTDESNVEITSDVTISKSAEYDNGNKVDLLITKTTTVSGENTENFKFKLMRKIGSGSYNDVIGQISAENILRIYPTEYHITNTLPKTDVSVTKIWDDQSNKFDIRPSEIKFTLSRTENAGNNHDAATNWSIVTDVTQSPAVALTQTITKDGNVNSQTCTFTGLLANSENNSPYYFKVDEDTVNGYTTTYGETVNNVTTKAVTTLSDKELTVTNTMDTVTVKAAKKWDDSGSSEGLLHHNIKITLSSSNFTLPYPASDWVKVIAGADGTEQSDTTYSLSEQNTYTVENANDGKYAVLIKGLNKTDTNGIDYSYKVNDTSAVVYKLDGETNKINLLVVKAAGGSNLSFKVQRSTDGITYTDVTSDNNPGMIANGYTLSDGNGVKFENLPKTNSNGETIVYKVTETPTNDAASSGQLTNVYENTGNTVGGTLPGTLTADVLNAADGTVDATLNATNGSFTVPTSNAVSVTETVGETQVEKHYYYVVVKDLPEDGHFVIGNVSGAKIVSTTESTPSDGKKNITITAEKAGNTDFSFKVDVQFAVASNRYGYEGTCKLDTDADGNQQFNILNTLPVVSFTAEKKWDDEYNRDNKRPDSLKFTLQRKLSSESNWTNVETKSAVQTGWNVVFGSHPQYNSDSVKYQYQVIEDSISDYTLISTTPGTDPVTESTDYTFTNKHDITEKQLTVHKIWNDNGYKDTVRPTDLSKINVKLMCRYKDANDNWVYHEVSQDTTEVIGIKTHIDAKQTAVNHTAYEVLSQQEKDNQTEIQYNAAHPYNYAPTLAQFNQVGSSEYTYTFNYLPVYINVDGTADSKSSKWYAVEYYVVEEFDENSHVYSSEYFSEKTYSPDGNGKFTIPAEDYHSGYSVLIRGLDARDGSNLYSYRVKDNAASCTMQTAMNGKLDVLITKMDSGSTPAALEFTLQRTVDGTNYTDVTTGITAYAYANTTPSGNTGTKMLNPTTVNQVTTYDPADKTIYVKNTPVTHDILVTKEWNDQYYGQDTIANANITTSDLSKNLHYDKTAITLTGTAVLTDGDDAVTVYPATTKYLAKANTDPTDTANYKGVVFRDVPIYDRNGKVINYKVTEAKSTTGTVASGYDLAVPGSGTLVPVITGEFEQLKGTGQYSYGYEGSAEKVQANGNGSSKYVTRYHITDTLPLTAVKVNKHWLDQDNAFRLRPTTIKDTNLNDTDTDSIALTIARRLSTSNNDSDWTDLRPTDAEYSTEWYTNVEGNSTTKNIPVSGNEWSYTYKLLLKYDENSTAYNFRISEARVTAYEEPKYCVAEEYDYDTDNDNTTEQHIKQIVTGAERNNPEEGKTARDDQLDWDGTHPLVETFEISNKLDTRDIKVYKTWIDGGHPETHYTVDFTLDSTYVKGKDGNNDPVTETYTKTETAVIPQNETAEYAVFTALPKYDMDGNVIVYNVTEKAHDTASTNGIFTVPAGATSFVLCGLEKNKYYKVVNAVTNDDVLSILKETEVGTRDVTVSISGPGTLYLKVQSSDDGSTYSDMTGAKVRLTQKSVTGNQTLTALPYFTEGTRKYGYAGYAEYVADSETIGSNTYYYATDYYVTNTLPLTYLKAVKSWDNKTDDSLNKYAGSDITLSLNRKKYTDQSYSEVTYSSPLVFTLQRSADDGINWYNVPNSETLISVKAMYSNEPHYYYPESGVFTIPLEAKDNSSYIIDIIAPTSSGSTTYKYRITDVSGCSGLTISETPSEGSVITFTASDKVKTEVKNSNDMYAEFSSLPAFDESNTEYQYQIVEQPLKGYTTAYSTSTNSNRTYTADDNTVTAAVKASTDPQMVYVQNTQILGDAEVIKIDQNHYDAFNDHTSGYTDIVLPGAKFELTYVNSSGNKVNVNVKKDADGQYILDASGSNNIVISDDSGKISFKNFPLNTYTLTETEVLHGYLKKETPAVFTIDVASAEATEAQASYDSGFVQGGQKQNRIGNLQSIEETKVTLVKMDAEDNSRKLPNATYYLLQMIPYSSNNPGYASKDAYNEAADKAITDCNFELTKEDGTLKDSVTQFWHTADVANGSHVPFVYTTNSRGEIEAPQYMLAKPAGDTSIVYAIQNGRFSIPASDIPMNSFTITGLKANDDQNRQYEFWLDDMMNADNTAVSYSVTQIRGMPSGGKVTLTVNYGGADPLGFSKDGFSFTLQHRAKDTSDGHTTVPDYYEMGSITGLMDGRYAFIEVQAPEGYERSYCKGFAFVTDKENRTVPIEHKDPRKKASLDVLKLDENGDPLDGAEFELYYQPDVRTSIPYYTFNSAVTPPSMTYTLGAEPDRPNPKSGETTYNYTYNYSYKTINPPTQTENKWILPRTDNDYIYFEENPDSSWRTYSINTGKPSTTQYYYEWDNTIGDSGKGNYRMTKGDLFIDGSPIYADFYRENGEKIGQYEIWERFVYYTDNSNGYRVLWKIQPPDGAKKVKFHQGWNKYDNKTSQIEFTKGKIYSNNGSVSNLVSGVDWINKNNSSGQAGYSGKAYEPTAQKLIFRRNSEYCWDNLHVEFFKNIGTEQAPVYEAIGESFPGYLMEPYAYADEAYRIQFTSPKWNDGDWAERYKKNNEDSYGNLTYEITIPKGATHFRINNGTNNSVSVGAYNGYGNYMTAVTALATDTNKKNYNNYWKLQKSGTGNSYGYSDANGTSVGLEHWSDADISRAGDNINDTSSAFAVDSDRDFVYFKKPAEWKNHVYAYFYAGGNLRSDNWQKAVYSIWPGVIPAGSSVSSPNKDNNNNYANFADGIGNMTLVPGSTFRDADGNTMYRFHIPLGDNKNYSFIMFSDGMIGSGNGTQTGLGHGDGVYDHISVKKVSSQPGYAYDKNGSEWQHADSIEATKTYLFRHKDNSSNTTTSLDDADYLYIRNNNSDLWDDIHITFYNAGGGEILQTGTGYVMTYAGTKDGYQYFRIPIPSNAAKFAINNHYQQLRNC